MKVIVLSLLLICVAVPAWAQKKGWEKEWNEIISAAKKEGKVVVSGPPDPTVRRELPTAFKARFGIPIEYIGGRLSQIAARLRVERRAGVYTVDAFLGSIPTMATILYPEKMLDPLKSGLMFPEVVDPSKWKKGKMWFVDPNEMYILRLFSFVSSEFHINTLHVKAKEFASIKDLLNPKWKGKISALDPTRGRGITTSTRLYLRFGEKFVKKLYIDQRPMISRNSRQLADWLARGTYPISLEAGKDRVRRLKDEGFPVATIYSLPDVPATINCSSGLVALMNGAPHPNAARIFINWLASREGLEVYARAQGYSTTRNDVDESFLRSSEIPRPGATYFDACDWKDVANRKKVLPRVKEIFRSR